MARLRIASNSFCRPFFAALGQLLSYFYGFLYGFSVFHKDLKNTDRSDLSYFYSGIMKVSEVSLDPFYSLCRMKGFVY